MRSSRIGTPESDPPLGRAARTRHSRRGAGPARQVSSHILGSLIGLIIVIPTFNPGDLIAGPGIGSVAIGFAFKDILQNWLAGSPLLLRRPFRVGDKIVANGHGGRSSGSRTAPP
ncbi:mechanosensitive ion channel [Rubellimicrobium roseum]|uniref:Mechanosensitive ion channel n=1 Tax=Rubellimicrobium roseum TaxID=687525 RepID=A0A5C4N8Z4_9RHOB|nr:mechanosensitive ion channel [Rubellimicrobium roseum]